ncbi:MAG: Gfo/Idh/MocA family oxidoreductase [Chloroflexi bacterium]|nr:Gfo/Idh/MocA family oxidoreductase [Chloroflexota bacterium]
MKQLIQHIDTGATEVVEAPAPMSRPGRLLVANAVSLVSAGTERMIVDFAEKNLLQKARSRPDLVKQTLEKAHRDGLLTTLEAARTRLSQPMPLGYSCAGVVIDVGAGVEAFEKGDRVACAGGGYAVHAEIVSVPQNLVVKLPDEVSFESAAFTTLAAIALQGVRLADVKLGEVVGVIGLGLLGQLTVQMLKASGCIVIGMDLLAERASLAQRLGADAVTTSVEEFVALCLQRGAGYGADAILITADTKSNQPVRVAGEAARDKGVVVAVGAVGMTIPRKTYYEKELDFRISRSYGPGRYDPEYEEKGRDYPYAYVRWTERRNMQACVQLFASGQVNAEALITHRFSIEEASRAYQLITGKSGEPFLGVVLTYPGQPDLARKIQLRARSESEALPSSASLSRVHLGVLGAGLYANATLLPALKGLEPVELMAIASGSGLSAQTTGKRFGFAYCASDEREILDDPRIDAVAILTRHHLHARQALAALQAGKHVFVEKPLCLTEEELSAIAEEVEGESGAGRVSPYLMVGYNRRFAPFVQTLRRHLRHVREPLLLTYRVNAGYIPPEHWLHDPAQGGGRLIGEGCHFIDLLIFLADSTPRRVETRALPNVGRYRHDNFVVTLEFVNGSVGVLIYAANGDKGFSKERLEVFGGGLSASLEDFRVLSVRSGGKKHQAAARLRADKGHRNEWRAFVDYLIGRAPEPMSFDDIMISTRATLAAQRSLERGAPIFLE